MTEEEAKTKTCHKTLAPHGGSDGVPSWCNPQPCIGSACMAWRWGDKPNPEYEKQRGVFVGGYPPAVAPPMYLKSDTDGFCGLAGKP